MATPTALGHLRALQNMHITYTYKRNPKVSSFQYCSHKKWQIKLGDAGTIDRFDLVFKYQIFFF